MTEHKTVAAWCIDNEVPEVDLLYALTVVLGARMVVTDAYEAFVRNRHQPTTRCRHGFYTRPRPRGSPAWSFYRRAAGGGGQGFGYPPRRRHRPYP